MKRLLLFLFIPLPFLFLAAYSNSLDDMHWSVRAIRVKIGYQEGGKSVERFCDEYYLYYGNRKTQQTEKMRSQVRIFYSLFLTHRTFDSQNSVEAPHSWYIQYRRSRHLTPQAQALYDEEIWSRIPDTIKNTIEAFGADDPDLLLVTYDIHTGSIKVFFHPRYKYNREFYEQKVKIVSENFTIRCC